MRAIVIVLDSFGIGALPDANKYNDQGSDTLGHIDEYCFKNNISFDIPNLLSLGLSKAYELVNNKSLYIDKKNYQILGSYGACQELSTGKDTTSGHWEMAGYPVLFEWGYFKNKENSFPKELLDNILKRTNIKGYLGNCHSSGTEIINKLGIEHIKTGFPIFYTSADSVFQIAASEEHFGLKNLYKLCEIVREELAPYNIARVIARPFIGNNPDNFTRTKNRHDYSLEAPEKMLFDYCISQNGEVIAIGKIADIYAHRGITVTTLASGIPELCEVTIESMQTYNKPKTIIMTNLVDFDMLFGHRRDVTGYKNALEEFDGYLGKIINNLTNNDVLILTADHGCDPTFPGSDHTREHVPFLFYSKSILSKNLGIRSTYADIGQTIADYLKLEKLKIGKSILNG